MSFFGSLLGDFEDDPFTGHMRQMNRMMNSFFGVGGSPFGGLMGGSTDLMPFEGRRPANAMMPFGFPDMDRMFQGIDQNRANCHAFTSSTVMTMSNGPDGRPQVYQASQSVRSGPGGVRETKKTVADSRSGVKKMAIGHHIGERSHILEREQNVRSGEQEEREEFINLEEEEAPEFNREWQHKARNLSSVHNAIGYPSSSQYGSTHRHRDNTPMLPSAPSQSNSVIYNEAEDNDDDDDDDEGGVSIVELDDDEDCEEVTPVTATTTEEEEEGGEENNHQDTHQKKENVKENSRKREHEPDVHYKTKVQKMHRDSNVSK